MKSTITARGQTVVPAEIRRMFKLSAADSLEWVVGPQGIRVVPVRRDPGAGLPRPRPRGSDRDRQVGGWAPGRPPQGVKRWLLDTSALLTLRDDEAGAQQVADVLADALARRAECHACFMTLMELSYRVWMDEGEPAARLAHEQCLSLPLQWVHESPPLLWEAAKLKAMHRMSIADAWIAAAAHLAGATLVHKDPEFVPLALPQLRPPFKA